MNTFPSVIKKEDINKLPLIECPLEIQIIETQDEAIKAAIELKNETHLGFDTETRPSFKKGESYKISLLQLSGASKAYLFRLNFFEMPQELIDILTNDEIIKTGVAIRDDIKGLQKLKNFSPAGFVEIVDLVKQHKIQHFGLRAIAAITLNGRISKGAKLTNWENKQLTHAQVKYAATDAWVGREIYFKLT